MTRILAAADLHIGARHLTTLEDQWRALERVCDVVDEEGVKVVLLAGDLTHHAHPTPEALAAVGAFFARLDELGVDVIAVPGNHDPLVPAIAQHFRGAVEVALEPRIVQVRNGEGQRALDVACLPYLPDRFVRAQLRGEASKEEVAAALTRAAHEIIRGFLAQRSPGVPMVFLGHGTVAGTETASGFQMGFVGGTEWRLMVEDLAEFDAAFVGHIHSHQAPAENVVVPGPLLPLDFSETGPKGVIVADVGAASTSWRFLEIPGPRPRTVELNGRQDVLGFLAIAYHPSSAGLTGQLIRIRATVDEACAREHPAAELERAARDAGAALVQVELDIAREDRRRNTELTADLDVARAIGAHLGGLEISDVERERLIARAGEQLDARTASEGAVGGSLEVVRVRATDFLGLERADLALEDDVIALAGPVGSGKSSLGCDLLRWGLFGVSRYGGRNAERHVRVGADTALVDVELRGADECLYRVVRKVKAGSRGATTTLDVLALSEYDVTGWRPLSNGKIEDGQRVINGLLGGLTDDILCASSLVIQREAGTFTTARPEERRRLLAAAAGLALYDELATDARAAQADARRARDIAEAAAAPLRERAARIPELQRQVEAAARDQQQLAAAVEELATTLTGRRRDLEKERERAVEHARVMADAIATKTRVDEAEAELARWDGKRSDAQTALALPAGTARVKAHEAAVLLVADLETRRDAEARSGALRTAAVENRSRLANELAPLLAARRERWAGLNAALKVARRQQERLDASGCPVLARIRTAELTACSFLTDAQREAATIADLEVRLEREAETTTAEQQIQSQFDAIVLPEAIDGERTRREHAAARAEMERLARELQEGAELLARAKQVLAEYDEAVPPVRERLTKARRALGAANALLLGFAGSPAAAAARIEAEVRSTEAELEDRRGRERLAAQQEARAQGALEEARAGGADLEARLAEVRTAALAEADYGKLVDAWRAVRIAVLENSVIPSVEDTANEILRMFPYGIQIALRTQRDRKSGDGQAEALDVAVLGGKAEFYEGCSGGQRTTIDVSLHCAIALVVSRRASTRLRFLFLDEPEGLDEAGRAALGAIVRWVADAFSLRVLLASHHEDLIAAVGGTVVEIGGEPGAAIVERAAREPVAA